jgi:hypothetical protein
MAVAVYGDWVSLGTEAPHAPLLGGGSGHDTLNIWQSTPKVGGVQHVTVNECGQAVVGKVGK